MSLFANLRVVELAGVLAGPSVGQFFAELGAEVIKIENPRTNGDVTRSWKLAQEPPGPDSAYFLSVNWGKQCLWADLNQAADREKVLALLQKADVVLTSYKPGDAEKLGMDYARLRTLNPRLIYAAITGYGEDAPRVGYDAVVQAESGFMSMNGTPESGPVKMPVALIDVLAAHHLKEAILLALLHRQQTGKGSTCSVSLMEAALSSLANQGSNWLNAGHLPGRMGNEHPNIVPYGTVFHTADGREVLVAVGTNEHFRKLCELLGAPGLATHPHFQDNAARNRNRVELLPLLTTLFAARYSEPLMEGLHQAGIPAGLVCNVAQALETSQGQRCVLAAKVGERTVFGLRQWVARSEIVPVAEVAPPVRL